MEPIHEARNVIKKEADALLLLSDSIGKEFENAIDLIVKCVGRVIVTGMGKSGLIGQKIASTMASTGTPAFFLHPAEGIHGDLGMIMRGDVVIALSNSGETEEILRILPVVKRLGADLISIVGKSSSTLGKLGDICLEIPVKDDACPLGLAPTSSTTAMLAMGDALAVVLLLKRGFSAEDFALFHPGGSLGKKLLTKVEDLMHADKLLPLVSAATTMREALFEITSKRLGLTGVVDSVNGDLVGVITDGDLRRALESGINVFEVNACDIMKPDPKRISRHLLAESALHKMEQFSITSLFVFENDSSNVPIGIIHLHDIIKAGIV